MVLASLGVALWSGCATDPKKPAGASATARVPFDQLEMLCAPVALDFDKIPGPDGFSVRIYAMSSRPPKAQPIDRGTLELLMYDGLLKAGGAEAQSPLCSWSYTAEELQGYAYKTKIGTSYGLTPVWGDTQPKQNRITVIARYTSPEGLKITSAPSVISVPAR